MLLIRIPLFLLGFLLTATAFAQQDTATIAVRANVDTTGSIKLRWAVSNAMAWKQSNKYGFIVERYTVVRDNVLLEKPERVVLTAKPLKPQPLNNWEPLATKNGYAAIIAQALYGEDFDLSREDAKGVASFIALAQELQQRYLVSMYAADLCYPAAVMAGWGLEDVTGKKGERYLYRIRTAVPSAILNIQMGSVYTSGNENVELPQPQELHGIFGDKSVLLTWNYTALADHYNAYFLEKSWDGKNFERVSQTPLVNMNSKDGKPVDRMIYTDSLKGNGQSVYYRVIGVNTFGQEGPPSEILQGAGQTKLIYVPHITSAVPDANGVLTVVWEFDERGDEQLQGFELQRSDQAQGPFVTVVNNIPPDRRNVTFSDLRSTNYFKINAVPKTGAPTFSFPVLVQPADSIPPAAPAGLIGNVDTTGVVTLSWVPNKEKDLYGYRIFRGNTKTEELVPLTYNAVTTTNWVDTISVHNLNNEVFYAVTALDQRYNQSEKSAVLTLEKPDLVPPSSPLITAFDIGKNGISLKWVTGGEENITSINVMRAEGKKPMEVIQSLLVSAESSYLDSAVYANQHYSYAIVAVTRSGLLSAPSPIITVQAPAQVGRLGTITSFDARRDRKANNIVLSWKHNVSAVRGFDIYRNEIGKKPTLIKSLKGFETSMKDATATDGTPYEYLIRIVLDNGRYGPFMKTVARNK